MPLSQIGQIALPVKNADLSETYYGETLGLRKLFRFGDLVFFDCAGVRLMLEESGEPIQPNNGVCHYFKVDHVEDTVDRLNAVGVAFDGEPHLIAKMSDHELWMAFFKDPDGHTLALMEERR